MLGFIRKGAEDKREGIVVPVYISKLFPCLKRECSSALSQNGYGRYNGTGKYSKESGD